MALGVQVIEDYDSSHGRKDSAHTGTPYMIPTANRFASVHARFSLESTSSCHHLIAPYTNASSMMFSTTRMTYLNPSGGRREIWGIEMRGLKFGSPW
jgi:hypothetical protein